MRIQLILWGLRRRPWRHVLIGISVALTVGVMIAFFSALTEISRLVSRADQSFERLYVKPRYLSDAEPAQYPLALREELARIPGVEEVLWVVFLGAFTPDEQFLICIGGADSELERNTDLFPVDADAIARWKSERQGAIVSDGIAEQLNLSVGDEGQLGTPQGPIEFKVSGISRGGPFHRRVVLHYDYVDQFLGRPGTVHDYRLVIAKGIDKAPIIRSANQIFRTHGFSVHTLTQETMMRWVGVDSARMLPNLLGLLGLLLSITTGLVIANTAAISVRERRAELATMRVLGFRRSTIGTLILSESMLVSIAGGIVGALVSWLVFRGGITLGLGGTIMESMKLNTAGVIGGLVLALLIPFVGTSFSSWLAVRAPLSEALRDAG